MKDFKCLLQFFLLIATVLKSNCNNLREGFGSDFTLEDIEAEDEVLISDLAERMKPRNFFIDADDAGNITSYKGKSAINISPKQFLHLHHMKSGGSSLNSYLSCALTRATTYYSSHDSMALKLSKSKLSECSYSYFKSCTTNSNHSCKKSFSQASYMEYCSPLSATQQFGWDDADAITMLRHPVDRVWSMFRFQTKSCFQCKDLKEVYQIMDEQGRNSTLGHGVCLSQLTNHITRNLQSTIIDEDWNNHDYDYVRLADALHNLQNRFVVVGLLERLEETVELLTHSFPWMSTELDGADKTCSFPKVNASPQNNHCGEKGTHWDLPDVPDEATRKIIEEHNQLDIKLYEVAQQQFELQLKAVSMYNTFGAE